jgi:hypothetical protein
MKPEKQQLIQDLLSSDARREITLLAGAQILRRRRHWRAAGRGFVVVSPFFLLFTIAVLWFFQKQSPPPHPMMMSATKSPAPIQVHSLTDDELLALFPNTPVGLVTLSDGRKRLIFPRPGDEQRFITRL